MYLSLSDEKLRDLFFQKTLRKWHNPWCRFTVGTAPQVITAIRQQQVIVSPGKLTLECEFDAGKPQADVRWYKDSREVKSP